MLLNKFSFLLLFLLSLILCCKTELLADEQVFLDYSVNVGGSLNLNIHNSNFTTLPGTTNCCGNDGIIFKDATGIGYSFWAGAIKHINLLKTDADLKLNLQLVNFSASYSDEAKIGNFIEGDNISDIISKQILTPALNVLALSPAISMFPLTKKNLPLAVQFGFNAGIILNGNYEMYEEILRPAEAFFENGEKNRNKSNEDIQDLSPFFFSLSAGILYELLHFENFTISPGLTFNYGLTNFIKNVNWTANSVNFGINIAYRFRKAESQIIPEFPAFPPPKQPNLELLVKAQLQENKEVRTGDTIFLPINITGITERNASLPLLFFQPNSDKIIGGYDKKALKNMLATTTNLEIGLAFGEPESLAGKRKQTILSLFKEHNLDANNINFTTIVAGEKKKYVETNQEMAYAKFNKNIVISENIKTEINDIKTMPLKINAEVIAGVSPYNCKIKYNINSAESNFSGEVFTDSVLLNIGEDVSLWNTLAAHNNHLLIEVTASDATQKSINKNLEITIIPELSGQKFVNSNKENNFTEEYVLGFFDFDGKEFIAVDSNAIFIISKHLSAGNKIEIAGYTDNFGTQQHNQTLALERAEFARKLFPKNQNISVTASKISRVDNISPYQRIQNRVAVARVLK